MFKSPARIITCFAQMHASVRVNLSSKGLGQRSGGKINIWYESHPKGIEYTCTENSQEKQCVVAVINTIL